MKLECGVVRDLLPLYAEGMAGDESKRLIEEHLASCPECGLALQKMKEEAPPLPMEQAPLGALWRAIRQRRGLAVRLAVCLVLAVLLPVLSWMLAPRYLPLEAVTQVVPGDDAVTVYFDNRATACRLEAMALSDEGPERWAWCLSAWTCPMDRLLGKQAIAAVAELSPPGERTYRAVLYEDHRRLPDGADTAYVHTLWQEGRPASRDDFIAIALPRLVLNYYLAFAVGLAAIFIVLLLVIHSPKARRLFGRLALLMGCYGAGHMLIKWQGSLTYQPQVDLFFILSTAAALFGAATALLSLREKQEA